jgi:hypothetical protein
MSPDLLLRKRRRQNLSLPKSAGPNALEGASSALFESLQHAMHSGLAHSLLFTGLSVRILACFFFLFLFFAAFWRPGYGLTLYEQSFTHFHMKARAE